MKILHIKYKDEMGNVYEPETAELIAGVGLFGDVHKSRPDRELSLADVEIKKNNAVIKGLCTDRFIPNIVFEKNSSEILSGMLYTIGDALIRITYKGKNCFPECPLVQAANPCGLSENVLFAVVVKNGRIGIGDCLKEKDKWDTRPMIVDGK